MEMSSLYIIHRRYTVHLTIHKFCVTMENKYTSNTRSSLILYQLLPMKNPSRMFLRREMEYLRKRVVTFH